MSMQQRLICISEQSLRHNEKILSTILGHLWSTKKEPSSIQYWKVMIFFEFKILFARVDHLKLVIIIYCIQVKLCNGKPPDSSNGSCLSYLLL